MSKIHLILLLMFFAFGTFGADSLKIRYESKIIGELPGDNYGRKHEGLAGAFSGIVGNRLFIGGGANFPEGKPWEDGIKQFHDKLYIFRIDNDSLVFEDENYKLPEPVAYGASVTLPIGVLCIGGNNSEKCFSKVYLIKENYKNEVTFQDFPCLPLPLSFASAVVIDQIVYVVGGSSSIDAVDSGNNFFKLDLSKMNTTDFGWETLPPFPGKGRIYSVVSAQSNGTRKCLYLFGGRNVNSSKEISVFTDGFVYDLFLQNWKPIATVDSVDFEVMAGTAFPDRRTNIILVGGAGGDLLLKEQTIRKQLGESITKKNTAAISVYKKESLKYYTEHPGFSRDILSFNTITGQLSKVGTFETDCPVTSNIVLHDDTAFLISGEIKPGIRTPYIYKISSYQQTQSTGKKFNNIIGLVIGILCGLFLLGISLFYFVNKEFKGFKILRTNKE